MNLLPLQVYHIQSFEAQVCKRHYYMYKVWNKRVYPQIPSIDSERHKYMTNDGMKRHECRETLCLACKHYGNGPHLKLVLILKFNMAVNDNKYLKS
jgi:hypothetical protein